MGHRSITKNAMDILQKYQEAEAILRGGPATFYFERIREYAEALFSPRFAPFQIGDRVKLLVTPKGGAYAQREWLVSGVAGVVRGVEFYKGRFEAMVVFDVDPDEGKGLYTFREDELEVSHD